ncbi:MAG: serine/threonine protein kinase [Ignavibacteriales bacterium]|nr:serine/threonine protein kinase [Ignavibacteriales bacterium]
MINKRYIVSKKLGEGRSKVFNVIDTEFPEREVAAKFLPVSASNEEKDFFREEYFIMQKLDHPNIIKSFELSTILIKDEDEDSELENFSHFLTMEYFPPTALLNYSGLKEEKKLNQIIKQICSVLYYLHQSNYVYYDLKAENILVCETNGNPIVKIIDLGFARHTLADYENNIQGTPYYLAPELLKNENHDYRVDFYSLGMLLYRIVYGIFPFKSENELDIYKAHIEDEFDLGPTIYSKKLINVIAKLINKNPEERYKNALQILLDLHLPIDFEIVKDLIPAKVFSDRKDAFNILSTYLTDKTSNEVFSVTGFDGSGKTTLMLEIFRKNMFSVLIENSKIKTGLEAIKYIFHKIILTEVVYREKENNYAEIINDLFDKTSNSFLESIKRIFNTLPSDISLTVIFDDYNLYDDFTKESLTEMIRIFQVKGIKVILTESSDFDHASSSLNNLCTIQLNQFTEYQLSEFLDLSYYPLFPKKELKKYILLYSDLQPGNIKQFIKDLILLKVCRYDNAEVTFQSSEDIILALQSSHEELYRMRLSNLNSLELKLAQIISAFEISIEQTILAALLDVSQEKLKSILIELEKKNIIDPLNLSNAPKINSFNFKKYIYSTISNRVRFHLVLANSIKKLFADFNVMELARQFELANEHEQSVEYLKKEIRQAEEISAYSYKRMLLERALRLNIQERTLTNLSFELAKTLYRLSDYKLTLENIYKINSAKLSEEDKNQLEFIKGSSLVNLRKFEEGKSILFKLYSSLNNQLLKQQTLVELAYTELDLNNVDEAEAYCKTILEDPKLKLEEKGKCYNLLGLIEIQIRNNQEQALKQFILAEQNYLRTIFLDKTAGIKVNIGNIYSMMGEKSIAEQYWQEAIKLNQNIGNLEQEALLISNYGVFYHENFNLEKANECWIQAEKIFTALGNQNRIGVTISNLGEVYLQTSDFQNAYDSLNKALDIFDQLDNKEESLNVLHVLGKFWFTVGEIEELEKTLNRYEYLLLTQENHSEKNVLNFNHLKLLLKLNNDKPFDLNSEISAFLAKVNNNSDINLYAESIIIAVEQLISIKKYDEALSYLSDNEFINFIGQNVIFRAQREYLFGKIAYHTQNQDLKSPIEYFENAYNLIEEESISELTWKILFTIAETYWERGNFHKAKKPRHYAYELINMIGENISNNKIRTAYFNQPERKKTIEKLILIGNQTQLNEFQKS